MYSVTFIQHGHVKVETDECYAYIVVCIKYIITCVYSVLCVCRVVSVCTDEKEGVRQFMK